MSYTLELGGEAPNFDSLLSTDGRLYSRSDINKRLLKVVFFTCNHCPYVTGSDELTRKEFNFPWLYLHDESQITAKDYGALKTPHFFVFNDSWRLIYTGRNTDNPRDTSQKTTNDLSSALEEAVQGKKISVPITNPVGCNIKWEGKPAHWMPVEACDLV